jgi:hypothetical protein
MGRYFERHPLVFVFCAIIVAAIGLVFRCWIGGQSLFHL